MTPSRYYVARLAQAFGFFRKNQRMADAASEMHLLREAEAQLGMAIWEKVEHIEELSVEYWNLRKFVKEREIVRNKLSECQARLDACVRAALTGAGHVSEPVSAAEWRAVAKENERILGEQQTEFVQSYR